MKLVTLPRYRHEVPWTLQMWRRDGLQAAEYSREQTLDRITIPTGPRLGKEVVSVSGSLRPYPANECVAYDDNICCI